MQTTTVGKISTILDRAFTKCLGADEFAADAVSKGASDDFRGAGAAAIDQYFRLVLCQPAGANRIIILIYEFAFLTHDHPRWNKVAGNLDGSVKETTWVVAQI